MPIHDLVRTVPAFPRIGVLRKGAPKTEDGKRGANLDHFRLDTDDPELDEAFYDLFGAEPRRIKIAFHLPTVDEVWDSWMKEYRTGGVLVRQCDSRQQVRWLMPDGMYSTQPVACIKDASKPCKCAPRSALRFVIPDLGRLGYFVLTTTSKYDAAELDSNLRMVTQLAARLGQTLVGIPMMLTRREADVPYTLENGRRTTRKDWLCYLEPDAAWVAYQAEIMRLAAIGALPPAASVGGFLQAPSVGLSLPGGRVMDLESGEVDYVDEDEPGVIEQSPAEAPAPSPAVHVQTPTPAPAQSPAPPAEPKGNGTAKAGGGDKRFDYVRRMEAMLSLAEVMQLEIALPENWRARGLSELEQAGKTLRIELNKGMLKLWARERDLGGRQSAKELGVTLEEIKFEELSSLARTVVDRIAALTPAVEPPDKGEQAPAMVAE